MRGGGAAAGESCEGAETYYRAMKPSHAARVAKTGRLVATGETFISPNLDYVRGKYNGVIMKLTVKRGTRDGLLRMGRRHKSIGDAHELGYLDLSVKGRWTRRYAQFKDEEEVINIGLGQGDALDYFNSNLIEWEVVRP
jgi:hypothetical protein